MKTMQAKQAKQVWRRSVRFLRADEAVSALEYAILVGVIAVAIATAIWPRSGAISRTGIQNIGTQIGAPDAADVNLGGGGGGGGGWRRWRYRRIAAPTDERDPVQEASSLASLHRAPDGIRDRRFRPLIRDPPGSVGGSTAPCRWNSPRMRSNRPRGPSGGDTAFADEGVDSREDDIRRAGNTRTRASRHRDAPVPYLTASRVIKSPAASSARSSQRTRTSSPRHRHWNVPDSTFSRTCRPDSG